MSMGMERIRVSIPEKTVLTGIKRITYRVHEKTADKWENFWVALGAVPDRGRYTPQHRLLNLGTFEIVLKSMIRTSLSDGLAVHGDHSAISVSIGVDPGAQKFVTDYLKDKDPGVLNFAAHDAITPLGRDNLWTPPWLNQDDRIRIMGQEDAPDELKASLLAGLQPDHVTIVEHESTIEAKAEFLEGLGGTVRKKIKDVRGTDDPLDSMQLWEVVFNEDRPLDEQFFIALVAGIDRQEKSQASLFERRRGTGMLQHVAYRVGLMDKFRFFFEEALGGNLLSETLEVSDLSGDGFTEQVFTYGLDVAFNIAVSEFIEIISRTKQGVQGVGVKEQAGVDLYDTVRKIIKSGTRKPIVDFPRVTEYVEQMRSSKATPRT